MFARVVAEQSFSGAARSLGLPVSAVSRRVARLERQLGVALLRRTTRKLALTEPGRLFHERSAEALAGLAEAAARLRDAQTSPRGRVRVTAPVDFAPAAEVVAEFLRDFPEVRVELDLTNRRVDLIEEGYDVALRAGELPESTLVAQRLADSPMRLVASARYLSARGTPAQAEELAQHECILFGQLGARATWTLRGPSGRVRVTVTGRLSVNHLQAARQAAVAGLGIALLPSSYSAEALAEGSLSPVLPDLSGPPGALWVVVPSRHMPPATRAFVAHVKRHFAEHGWGSPEPRR